MKRVAFAAFALNAQPATCTNPVEPPTPAECKTASSTTSSGACTQHHLRSTSTFQEKASSSDTVEHPVSPRTTVRPAKAAGISEVEAPAADGDSVPHDLENEDESKDSLDSLPPSTA